MGFTTLMIIVAAMAVILLIISEILNNSRMNVLESRITRVSRDRATDDLEVRIRLEEMDRKVSELEETKRKPSRSYFVSMRSDEGVRIDDITDVKKTRYGGCSFYSGNDVIMHVDEGELEYYMEVE